MPVYANPKDSLTIGSLCCHDLNHCLELVFSLFYKTTMPNPFAQPAYSSHYPRDLVGYGAQPPQANWPGK